MVIIILFQFGLIFVSKWICAPSMIGFIKYSFRKFYVAPCLYVAMNMKDCLAFGLSLYLGCPPPVLILNLDPHPFPDEVPRMGGVVGPWKGSSSSQWDDIECMKQLKSIFFIIWSKTVRLKTAEFYVWVVYFEVI